MTGDVTTVQVKHASAEVKHKRGSALATLSDEEERFVVAFVSGKSVLESFRLGWPNSTIKADSTARSTAYGIFKRPRVERRILQLRDKVAMRGIVTLENHLEALLALRNRAASNGAYGAAIAAEIARGRASGVAVDKSEVLHKIQPLPSSVDDFV